MRTIIAAMALTTACAGLAAAADSKIEQRKADQLARIDERIVHLQEERACIQAATSHEALKACHEKFRSEVKADKARRNK